MNESRKSKALGIFTGTISLSLLALLIASCASSGAETRATTDSNPAMAAPSITGKDDKITPAMDELATELSNTQDVYRVANSIILRFLDEDLFRQDDRSQLSPRGDSILKPIANALRKYPTTRIYIQEFVPNQQAKVSEKRHALDQAFTIQSALIELGIPANRISVDVRPRPSSTTTPSPVSPSTHPATGRIFELNIVPAT